MAIWSTHKYHPNVWCQPFFPRLVSFIALINGEQIRVPVFFSDYFFRRVSDIGAGANIELITRAMIHSVSRDNWANLTSSDTVTGNFASFQKYRSLFVRKTYLSLPRMPLHKLIGFKFFFLVWHNSGHFEKESWFCGWHLGLSVWLLVVVGMVTRVGMSEHFPVMSPCPRARVLGCGVVTEGEHVEGGRGGAVQHGGAPHSLHQGWSLSWGYLARSVLAAMLGLWLSPHSRVLIEWLRKPQNFVTRAGSAGWWLSSLWCCGCPLSPGSVWHCGCCGQPNHW